MNRREKIAAAIHSDRQHRFGAQHSRNQLGEPLRVVALPRRLPGCGDVKAVLHHAGDHVANGLGKHDHAPTGRAQHMGKVGEGEQRQCIGTCLYPIKGDDIVDEAAAR